MDMLRATPTVSTRTLKNVLAGRLISPVSDSKEELLRQYITALHGPTNLELVTSVSQDKSVSSSVAHLASGSQMKRSACVCVCARARVCVCVCVCVNICMYTVGRPLRKIHQSRLRKSARVLPRMNHPPCCSRPERSSNSTGNSSRYARSPRRAPWLASSSAPKLNAKPGGHGRSARRHG